MTKEELKAYLGAHGGVKSNDVPYKHPEHNQIKAAWKEAIQLHNKATGTILKPGCSSCIRKTWEWLNK